MVKWMYKSIDSCKNGYNIYIYCKLLITYFDLDLTYTSLARLNYLNINKNYTNCALYKWRITLFGSFSLINFHMGLYNMAPMPIPCAV